MKFPMIVYKSDNSDFCGLLPDFPGIFMAEGTLDELASSAQEAVEVWMDGEDASIFPVPSTLDKVAQSAEAKGRTLMMVDIDPAFLDKSIIRISISVPRYSLAMIDKAAKVAGMTRSAFLVEKALT